MKKLCWLPALGSLVLCACNPQPSVPNGTFVVDEEVTLARNDENLIDEASRELTVNDDSIIVAFVVENLTDVKLGISATGVGRDSPKSVEVENHLAGAGIEIVALTVNEDARVRVSLTGGHDSTQPGKVRLRVQQFEAGAEKDPEFAAHLEAFAAWARGTSASLRTTSAKDIAPTEMQRAIERLEAMPEDAALAAQARLVRARQLTYFKIDWREARAEAQRASAAFAKLLQPDAVGAARAKYVEALALAAMSADPKSENPSAAEAMQLARTSLEELSGSSSALAPIGRARAIAALGHLDVQLMMADSANKHFEDARAVYQAQGYSGGEREMRVNLGLVLVAQGRFEEAARAFDAMLPELGKISDLELRVTAQVTAARGQSFAGRTDEATDLLLMALPIAREYELRDTEATVLLELGNLYLHRGDLLQTESFFDEALIVSREGKDVSKYVTALTATGQMARYAGDLERAIEMHKEAVRLAPDPVLQVRSRFHLGADYYRADDFPAAIAVVREGLAIDLHDPMSHIYTDGKLALAQFLAEYEKSTDQDLADADRLIKEALATSVRVLDPWRVIYCTRVRGQLDVRLGHNAAALAGFEKVLVLGRQYRERSGGGESRATLLKDEQDAFYGLLDIALADVATRGAGVIRPATADELSAVRKLERARQEGFGALRIRSLDAPSEARIDALLADMGQKSVKIAAMIPRDLDPAQQAELRALQFEMARMHAELDVLRVTAADRQARETASAGKAQADWRTLTPGAVQLSYALGRKHVYATVRSASGTNITVLVPSRQELEQKIGAIGQLDMRTDPGKVEAALAQLSSELMPAGLLPKESTAVEIVSEGRIASVPFAALRSPMDSQRRLVETHDITMITSMLDVDEAPPTRHARPFRLVALASGSGTYRSAPVDPVPRLQAATKEISAVAALFKQREPSATIKLLTGASGNAAALRDIWSSGVDVVHFATHALADLRQPVASLLVLPATDANGKSTYLTAGQVQAWHGDAELVFLSACESAIGPPQYAVGLPGLQRAFLRAGARGVVATLAPIEDVLAQEFAADFYARYTRGQPARRALSETQRAWLTPQPGMNESVQQRRRVMALAHAYFAG